MESNKYLSEILIKWYESAGGVLADRAGIQTEKSNKLLEYETDFRRDQSNIVWGKSRSCEIDGINREKQN